MPAAPLVREVSLDLEHVIRHRRRERERDVGIARVERLPGRVVEDEPLHRVRGVAPAFQHDDLAHVAREQPERPGRAEAELGSRRARERRRLPAVAGMAVHPER